MTGGKPRKHKTWRGYRNCDRCTRWRPVSDFTVYKTRTGYEQIKGECQECKRQREHERYQSLSEEEKRKKGKKANEQAWQRRNHALEFIERQRKILDEQNHQIEKLSDRLALIKKKNASTPPRTIKGVPALDVVPFRMWLLHRFRERGYDLNALAKEMGQDASRVRRWLDGYMWKGIGRDPTPIRVIDIDTVDKIAVNLGDPGLLERLYPLEGSDV
jgi:hypothetical protein